MHYCIHVAMVYMPFSQVVCIHNMYTWLYKYVLSVQVCTQQPGLCCEIQSNVLSTHAYIMGCQWLHVHTSSSIIVCMQLNINLLLNGL